jgi:uncharacterized protein (TIGR02449 family)
MDELTILEQKVEGLLTQLQTTSKDNGNLKVQFTYLRACCQDLLKKNQHASNKIQQIILKLKEELAHE